MKSKECSCLAYCSCECICGAWDGIECDCNLYYDIDYPDEEDENDQDA